MIGNSLEWPQLRYQLNQQIRALPFNPDLRTMLRNIDNMVEKLSKQEVVARRLKKNIAELEELKQVNTSIDTLSQWIVMANLIR